MKLVLVRHGATAWSVSGRHTGRTDLALLDAGRREAETVRPRVLANVEPASLVRVRTSPAHRARQTAAIVLGDEWDIEPDDRLWEVDYGDFEGLTKAEIHERAPGWTVFDGCPGGESLSDVEHRVDAFLAEARADAAHSTTVVFAHGHVLRILAARAVGQSGAFGRHLALDTASVSVIADRSDGPAIALWNDTRY